MQNLARAAAEAKATTAAVLAHMRRRRQ